MTAIEDQIKLFMSQKNYPCIAAIQSFALKDYRVRSYRDFGKIDQRAELRADLLDYLHEYLRTKSRYFTFWAVFADAEDLDEEAFERLLWSELSALTSNETKESDADPRFSTDPDDKKFCFAIGGKAFFVVGLHPRSSRLARRFPWPTLIFNVYEQFDQLAQLGLYQPMIETNRKRDARFQGDANPTVVQHGDDWESIQFSGRKNSPEWKCPFHFRSQNEKTR
jgi:FPC/CPF motif-containing protein YcgG